uniref:NADH dehydrogenase subunit 2 n=1 Tax=Cocculina enigmadonta TaxID=2729702 RepID=UPI00220F1532|nr:NADH dehydrogenase subunit 2 [Cocculina enigmadonta]UXN84359.1 NADH dehydrogenase subunit 2 [Cocculina enigmadonta]
MMISNITKFLPYSMCFSILLIFGTFYSLSSIHWLPMWIGMEINLIAFIPLILTRGSTIETESAIKYFIFQALGSAIFIMGSALAYGSQFSWDISHFFITNHAQILILTGLLIKMGGFPTHFWLPSVASGISWPANFILFIWQKIAPMFIMYSLLSHHISPTMIYFILMMSASSAMVGAIGVINQTQIRALLAYSSISHLGWMIFSCTLTKMSLKIYFLSYILISSSIIIISWWLEFTMIKSTSFLVSKIHIMTQPMIMLFFLSLGGIPPLLGFIPKWLVMTLSAMTLTNLMILLILIISSLISLFYYLSLIMSSFFEYTTPMNIFSSISKNQKTSFIFIPVSTFMILNLFGIVVILNFPLMEHMYAMGFFNKP